MKPHHLATSPFTTWPAALCAAGLILGAGNLAAAEPIAVPLGAFSAAGSGPTRIAVDAAGRIYVAAAQAGQVSVLDAFGRTCDVRHGFAQPLALGVDSSGNVYVGEARKGSVSVWNSQWRLVSRLGRGDGEFLLPADLAIDPISGDVFVCDSRAHQVKVYHAGERTLTIGGYGPGDGQFDFPAGVCLTSGGEVWVVDQNNDRVEIFDRAGLFLRGFALGNATGGSLGAGQAGRSQGIACDRAGRVFVADAFQGLIRAFDSQGLLLSTLGGYGEGAGQLRSPVHLAIDRFGRLLVASVNNNRIELMGLDNYIQLTAIPARSAVPVGTSVSFSVAVQGSGPFRYQWHKGGSSIPGATDATLAFTATADDSGRYTVEVTDPTGRFVSPEAMLTVQSPPAMVAQPVSQAVALGTPVTFAVQASGDALAYQWQRNGQDLPSATDSSLLLASAQLADSGSYRVRIANLVDTITSQPAQLSVFVPPAAPQLNSVSLQPDDGVQLLFSCEPGYSYCIEASTDMIQWIAVARLFCETDSVGFSDPDGSSLGRRFYRLRWTPRVEDGGSQAH